MWSFFSRPGHLFFTAGCFCSFRVSILLHMPLTLFRAGRFKEYNGKIFLGEKNQGIPSNKQS